MWLKYKTRPVVREAMRIENPAYLCKMNHNRYLYDNGDGTAVSFMTHQENPKAGDYIVKESNDDVYLVPQAVFLRKYEPITERGLGSTESCRHTM